MHKSPREPVPALMQFRGVISYGENLSIDCPKANFSKLIGQNNSLAFCPELPLEWRSWSIITPGAPKWSLLATPKICIDICGLSTNFREIEFNTVLSKLSFVSPYDSKSLPIALPSLHKQNQSDFGRATLASEQKKIQVRKKGKECKQVFCSCQV